MTNEKTPNGIEVRGLPTSLHLTSNLPVPYILAHTEFTLDRPIFFVLSWGPPEAPATLEAVEHAREVTIAGWRAWAKTSRTA